MTFREFLQSVKERSVSVYENADYLFEELVEKLEIERDLSRNPLFDTMFILQNIGQEKLALSDLTIREK
ncbi:MAG: condensation domain-containing protein, partial [Bacillota bacterium]